MKNALEGIAYLAAGRLILNRCARGSHWVDNGGTAVEDADAFRIRLDNAYANPRMASFVLQRKASRSELDGKLALIHESGVRKVILESA